MRILAQPVYPAPRVSGGSRRSHSDRQEEEKEWGSWWRGCLIPRPATVTLRCKTPELRHLARRKRCWQVLLIVVPHGRAASLSQRGSKPFMTCLSYLFLVFWSEQSCHPFLPSSCQELSKRFFFFCPELNKQERSAYRPDCFGSPDQGTLGR